MSTIHLTKEKFINEICDYNKGEWHYLGKKPAIVDFYATWCGPCKMIAPILEELSDEYAAQIAIYKVDTEEAPELSAAFGIQSIPTLLFIPLQGAPQIVRGAMPKHELKKIIDEFLLKPSK